MRRTIIPALLLAALLVAAFLNTRLLNSRGEAVIGLLEQAEACAQAGDRERAAALTGEAQRQWERWEPIFLAVQDHDPVDEVSLQFRAAASYLRGAEPGGEYSAANEALILRIRLILEMEQLSLSNFL